MIKILSRKGLPLVVMAILIAIAAGWAGYFVWTKARHDNNKPNTSDDARTVTNGSRPQPNRPVDNNGWLSVTTQGGGFSMNIPDGWRMSSYPGDYLGSMSVDYRPGYEAAVDKVATEYAGHTLRFRASIEPLNQGLKPQWESPQPGLQDSVEDYVIGDLKGKRHKAIFTGDLNQTLYEYIFDLGDGRKLDIVYSVYHDEHEYDDVLTVEKALQTIRIR